MNKLNNITTQYRKFSKGQYIEHTQFNEFLDYFDDQDRLSRIALQGVGIVCGLEHQLRYNTQTSAQKRANQAKQLSGVEISQGVAVTTDGDFLTLSKLSKKAEELGESDLKTLELSGKVFTHVKVFEDDKAEYPAFDNNGSQVLLWELATSEEATKIFDQ